MDLRRRNFSRILITLSLAALTACASARKSTSGHELSGTSGEVMGPPRPEGPLSNGEVYGPGFSDVAESVPGPTAAAPLIRNPDKVALVLGPGLTYGYSAVGAIKALVELKVPVHAIYGTEIGALVGALYYTQPNPNRIDWALLRFNENNLRHSESKLAALKFKSPEEDLEERLKEVFGERRVETYADRLHILLEDAKTGEKLEAKSGELWRAVRGALAGANGFAPIDFEGRTVRASTKKMSDEYRIARQVEGYPIVVVLAGKQPSELFRKLIEEQKSTLIYVPLAGIDNLDLKKRNQAVFAGKSAVHQAANEILGLVGRKLE